MTTSTRDGDSRQDIVTSSLDRARTLWGTRIAPALMAPLGILLTIPLLVGGVGLTIWWRGHVSAVEGIERVASQQFRERAEQGARFADELFAQAEPLTTNMVAYVRRVGLEPDGEFALHFRDQLRACRDVVYISFGTHEGNYFGVYRDNEGRFVHTDRRYGGPGRTLTTDYEVRDDDTLVLYREPNPSHGYDPRQRPWWKEAVANGRRTWSKPYVWYDLHLFGITRSEPIYGDDGQVIAVTTVDFHLNGLSEFVERLGTADGQRTFVFNRSRKVLAFPGVRQKYESEEEGSELHLADIDDPAVAAFDAALDDELGDLASVTSTTELPFAVDGDRHLAVLCPLSLGEDRHWFVATMGPTRPLVEPAFESGRTALLVSAIALVIAILVAAFFARFIVRTHLRIERAEDRARAADERLERLGSYRMTRKLEEGGMGEVWIAEHDMLARPAAVKLIRPDYLASKNAADREHAIRRFRREARTIAGLRSRHTVGIYDFGVADDGSLFYVMELLDGIDLRTLVKRYGAVPPRRGVEILRQAAWSLQEAHEHGVIHRDVKPPNIFLCREAEDVDVVKVLDFGVARHTQGTDSERTQLEGLTGTPSCMAPEQVRDQKDLDGRADVYALGCIAYWLIAGRNVFVRDSMLEVLRAQLNDTPEPLSSVAPSRIPRSLEDLIARCLAKRREDRPADMRELALELEAVLRDLPDDGWDEAKARAWWAEVPSIFEELAAPDEEGSRRLNPQR